jgi:hypothetical protein
MFKMCDEDLMTRNRAKSSLEIQKIDFNTTDKLINILNKTSRECRDRGILWRRREGEKRREEEAVDEKLEGGG